MRIGHGYDVHALADGIPLFIGGVRIKHDRGLLAHSDGDVLIHALCDALLGAAGLGDIGRQFPDTSDEFKGIDSRILLRKVVGMLRDRQQSISNVDMTVVAQSPKLSQYIDTMISNLSEDMQIDKERINVKATTTEKLGFSGREEGIAAHAVVLLNE